MRKSNEGRNGGKQEGRKEGMKSEQKKNEEEAASPVTSCNLLNSEIRRDRESQASSIRQLWITMKLFYYSARAVSVPVC